MQDCPNGVCAVPAATIETAISWRTDLSPKAFDGALAVQMKSQKHLTAGERKVAAILNSPDSPTRSRKVAYMESHIRVALDLSPTAAIDWSTINWAKVFQTIMSILIALLPLL